MNIQHEVGKEYSSTSALPSHQGLIRFHFPTISPFLAPLFFGWNKIRLWRIRATTVTFRRFRSDPSSPTRSNQQMMMTGPTDKKKTSTNHPWTINELQVFCPLSIQRHCFILLVFLCRLRISITKRKTKILLLSNDIQKRKKGSGHGSRTVTRSNWMFFLSFNSFRWRRLRTRGICLDIEDRNVVIYIHRIVSGRCGKRLSTFPPMLRVVEFTCCHRITGPND